MNKRELKRPETVEVEAIGSFHLAWSWQSGVESAACRSPQGAVRGWRSREFAPCQKARSASPASYTLLGQSFGITQQAVVAGEVEGLRVFLLNCDIFSYRPAGFVPSVMFTRECIRTVIAL
jgi:hypothetical protein